MAYSNTLSKEDACNSEDVAIFNQHSPYMDLQQNRVTMNLNSLYNKLKKKESTQLSG